MDRMDSKPGHAEKMKTSLETKQTTNKNEKIYKPLRNCILCVKKLQSTKQQGDINTTSIVINNMVWGDRWVFLMHIGVNVSIVGLILSFWLLFTVHSSSSAVLFVKCEQKSRLEPRKATTATEHHY